MNIAGFIPISFVDWDGYVSSVVFTRGCNFRCPYCQNHVLISFDGESMPQEVVIDEISKRKPFIDGVVITGGEPTLWSDLPDFCAFIKEKGLKVKLDTNGYMPDMLLKLIRKGLIDYVAMDIKAPLYKYSILCGVEDIDVSRIVRSIEILKQMVGKDYFEFRTTFAWPLLNVNDLVEIALLIGSEYNWFVQKLDVRNVLVTVPFVSEARYMPSLEEIKRVVPFAKFRGF